MAISYSRARSLLESVFTLLSKYITKFSKDDHNSFKDYKTTISLLREINSESFFTQNVLSLLQKFDENLRALIDSQGKWYRFLTTNRARSKLDSIHVSLALQTSRHILTQSVKSSTTVVPKSWASRFGGALAVPWDQFIAQIKATESIGIGVNEEKILKYLIDPTKVGMVIPSRFSELLESFGTSLNECIYNISQLGRQPWFYGFMTIDESKRFLEEQEVGTFLVRFSGTKPGAFTIDYVAYVEDDMKHRYEEDQGHLYGSLIRNSPNSKSAKKKVLSLRLENVHGRFHLKEADAHSEKLERTLVFPSLDKVVEYAPDQFQKPLTSTLARLPCFYGTMDAIEAEELLQGHPAGTYLLRFSSNNDSKNNCIVVVSFIDEKSSVHHARVIKISDGIKINGDNAPKFSTIEELIAFYTQQRKLIYPLTSCVDRELSSSLSSSSPAASRLTKSIDEEEEWDPIRDFATVKYNEGSVLGRGSYGMVSKCKVVKTGCNCAMKKFSLPEDLPEEKQKKLLESFVNELNLMKQLRHENIIRVLGYKTEANSMMIFMECMDCSLAAVLRKKLKAKQRRGSSWYTLEELKGYALQIAEGLNYLHSQNIVHRDLKPENVLVLKKGSNTINTLKITDFGVSKQVDQMQPYACTIIGTTEFMAPEVFEQNYGYPADIWSYGMVLYSLLTGNTPRFNLKQLVQSARAPLPKEVQSEYPFLADIFEKCTTVEPSNRPTASQLLELLNGKHPDNNND